MLRGDLNATGDGSLPDVRIRSAAPDDLARLTEIYNRYVVHTPITFDLEPFSVDERRAWFERYGATGCHQLLVAERDGVVVAYASSSPFRLVRTRHDPVRCVE